MEIVAWSNCMGSHFYVGVCVPLCLSVCIHKIVMFAKEPILPKLNRQPPPQSI